MFFPALHSSCIQEASQVGLYCQASLAQDLALTSAGSNTWITRASKRLPSAGKIQGKLSLRNGCLKQNTNYLPTTREVKQIASRMLMFLDSLE